jgi:RNA polymerase sigma-70 factor (ECF subfamily)
MFRLDVLIVERQESIMPEPQEKQLIHRSRQGDTAAYAELIRMHSRSVFAICLGIMSHHQDAEDIVQQTLLQAYANLPQLRKTQSFGPWLYQIARNLCLDLKRKHKRDQQGVEQHRDEQTLDCLSGVAQDAPDFSGLLQAMAGLSPQDRTALSLYYFEGQSTACVARILDVSEPTLLVRLSRARAKLRSLLEETGGAL